MNMQSGSFHELNEAELKQYAFCQGGIQLYQPNRNRRPLMVFCALSGMIRHFRQLPSHSIVAPSRHGAVGRGLRQAGERALSDIELNGVEQEDREAMVRRAAEIFSFADDEQKMRRWLAEPRAYPAMVPDYWVCRRIWRDEAADEFHLFMSDINRAILAKSLPNTPTKKRHTARLQLVR